MSLEARALTFAAETKLDAGVIAWLEKTGLTTLEDIAEIAHDEASCDIQFIAEAFKEGVSALDKTGPKVATRKFWKRCKAAFEADLKAKAASLVAPAAGSGTALVNGEAEIPVIDAANILKLWKDRHGFILPDSQLLIPNQQGRLWRDFMSDPKSVSYWDARNLRPRSMVNAPTGTAIMYIPGKELQSQAVIADNIDRAFELWTRCRAYLMSMSFGTITDPDYFPYQQAVNVSDILLKMMMDTHRGHYADVEHLIGAWASTSLYWSDQCRVLEKTPAEIFPDVGKWHHKWTWVPSPGAVERSQPGRPAAQSMNNDDSLTRQLQNRLDAVTGQVKHLQAAADRQHYDSRRATTYENRDAPDRRDGRAKGGKAKGRGKGKGGNFQQAQSGSRQIQAGSSEERSSRRKRNRNGR